MSHGELENSSGSKKKNSSIWRREKTFKPGFFADDDCENSVEAERKIRFCSATKHTKNWPERFVNDPRDTKYTIALANATYYERRCQK